ncbi:three-Cys-motif partner protein TcmP [Nonomuraea sp. NPDC050310]|uniref:three-Cys-motif partner protein TcmP n=1 Tax=unclassified Nonomuraea TaxID=2593643 RepID=UPI0033E3F1AC
MATGTSADLLNDLDRNAQSLFKHAILSHYLEPFIAMTGSTARGRRVVVMDGFAGRGRYDDGSPGSAEHILQAILRLKARRNVSAFFVEKDPNHFAVLAEVVDEYAAQGLAVTAWNGRAENHLATVVAAASGVPLFLFLDPTGAGVSFEPLSEVLRARPHKGPATEVLVNFSADLSRRVVGAVESGRSNQRVMDDFCGGTWWRQTAKDVLSAASGDRRFEAVADALAAEYAARLSEAGQMTPVCVPVRRQLSHQPIYHLVFFTRSPYGLWVFANAVGMARRQWLAHLDQQVQQQATTEPLFELHDHVAQAEQCRAIERLRANLLVPLQDVAAYRLVTRTTQVFDGVYGIATDDMVRTAMTELEAAGRVRLGPGKFVRDWYVRRP